MNCIDARAECHRTRQARVHRPRVSRIDALSERLARLEKGDQNDSVFLSPPSVISNHDASRTAPTSPQARYYDPARASIKRKHHQEPLPHEVSPSEQTDRKRRISQTTGQKGHGERHSLGSTRHASEAREYIESELQCNPALSHDRRTALETARKFVGQLSNPGLQRQEAGVIEDIDIDENWTPPTLTPEFLHMMLPGPDKKTNSQTISWPDHISDRTLERMGLAIIERTENETILQLYRITVWVKAICFISALAPMISSEPLKVHFRRLKKQYEVSAIDELNSIPLTAPPSLVLLQALLSGKRLYQYLGNMSRCWMFTAVASRVLVALNYHNITDAEPQNDVEDDIHACVYTCYYFDKTLSLLLLRPQSLPDLKVEPAQLIHMDSGLPTTPMITAIVEFSHLKNTLVDILLDNKEMGAMEKATILSDLVARAHTIHASFQAHRSRQEMEYPDSWEILRCEWLSMDFNYYSLTTTIIRARSAVLKSRLVCEDCLYAARKALTTLRALQEAFSNSITTVDSYPYFLTWTMLLSPLSPFFVLFCNVVATSDQRDFEMIKKITDDLSQFTKANASIGKLHGLFSKFLDLCAPLIKPNHDMLESMSVFSVDGKIPQVNSYPDVYGRTGDQVLHTLPSPMISRAASGMGQGRPGEPQSEGWDDSLMWELFDNQPSLGWAESELWDAMAQLDAS
ncbi:transcriptional regulator family: Fungal Specific TF [Penicillium atrosanguineum]|nr:transcriptional regulator family: Fungal Specific TF [Penicillium atrosanguineum]